jgi:radical SAM protein with 4Fe4S-binding SPASM domain
MSQIKIAQIDPNGICNSGCWYCPVAYSPNPKFAKKDMSINLLESILKQLKEGVGDFVAPSFDFIYTAHYNEVLLYKHFEEMLSLFRKYEYKTFILSNGIPLTEDKVNLIEKYQDVVSGICLNIPAAEPIFWGKLTNMNPKIFDKITKNVSYAIEKLPLMFSTGSLSIQMNGLEKKSLRENGGTISVLENSPVSKDRIEHDYLDYQVNLFKKQFPGLNVYKMSNLIDRAGHLDTFKALTNIDYIKDRSDSKKVVGCSNMGSRTEDWIHINANGDMFICCNDYDFDTVYENINNKSIKDIWESNERKNMIQKSYSSLCTTCSAAIWE